MQHPSCLGEDARIEDHIIVDEIDPGVCQNGSASHSWALRLLAVFCLDAIQPLLHGGINRLVAGAILRR